MSLRAGAPSRPAQSTKVPARSKGAARGAILASGPPHPGGHSQDRHPGGEGPKAVAPARRAGRGLTMTKTQWTKKDLLSKPIQHIDITGFDARAVIESYRQMAYTSRTLANAADIYSMMLA